MFGLIAVGDRHENGNKLFAFGQDLNETEFSLEEFGIFGYFEKRTSSERRLDDGEQRTLISLIENVNWVLEIIAI